MIIKKNIKNKLMIIKIMQLNSWLNTIILCTSVIMDDYEVAGRNYYMIMAFWD